MFMSSRTSLRGPALILAVALCPIAACATSRSRAPADPCGDFTLDVKKVWSQSTRVSVEGKLLERWGGEGQLEVARQRASAVITEMDRFGRSWVMMREAVCNDHFKRGLLDKDDYRVRVQCLDAALQRQNTLVQAMTGGGELASDALTGLDRELQQCGR